MIALSPFPTGEEWGDRVVERWLYRLVSAFNVLTGTGTTAQRPNPAPFIGYMYFDTTLGRPIWAKTATQYVFSDGLNA